MKYESIGKNGILVAKGDVVSQYDQFTVLITGKLETLLKLPPNQSTQ